MRNHATSAFNVSQNPKKEKRKKRVFNSNTATPNPNPRMVPPHLLIHTQPIFTVDPPMS